MLQKTITLLVLLPITCNATLTMARYGSRNSASVADHLLAPSKFQALGPELIIPFLMNCANYCSITVGCSAFSFNGTSHSCQPFLFDPTLVEEEEEDGATQPEFLVKHENGSEMDWTLPAAFGSLIATDHGYSQGSDDNWYYISPDTKDWYSAKAACLTTSGSRLAVPKSRPEYDQILSLKSSDEFFWLGLSNPGLDTGGSISDVSTYVVDSHDNSSFNHEPYMRHIDLNGNDHCIMMKKSIYYGFAETQDCTKQFKYICQIRIT